MIENKKRLVTAEAVRRGHPDKFCDQIADAILDAHLSYDPNARVAVEVMATAGSITIAGEITSKAEVNYDQIVAGVIHQIGYKWYDLCEDRKDQLDIQVALHEQSTDIAAAVNGRFPDSTLGAGDQGIMYGYATDETWARMPRAFMIAQKICQLLDEEGRRLPWLGADGKAQVSLIPRELWDAVQQRFDKTNGKTMNRKNGHFLSGKLYCGKCGGVFRRKTVKNRAGYTSKIWKCRGREEGLCTAPIWKEDVLIDEISGKLGITCDEAGIADMGTILIGDEIEWTT